MKELREFVCKHCGHSVVVNPKLPDDYLPNTCTPCWEKIDKPRHDRAMREIFFGLENLLKLCGLPPVR